MKTFVASAVLLGMIQQTLADDAPAPKYIPPLPKPAVVKPAAAPPSIFNIQRLIAPAPVANVVLPPLRYPKPTQPQPVYYPGLPPKRIEEARIEEATRADLKKQNRPGVTSFIHRTKHVSAKELARRLGRKFAMNQVTNASLQKNKSNAVLVIIPEEKSGRLIITTSPWNVDEIKRLISEIDRIPKLFRIETSIKAVGADGKSIVARPIVSTFENQLVTVQVKNSDGTSIELQIKVQELTPPQPTSPTVKKATARKSAPHLMPATPTTASYRPVPWKPLYRTLIASYQPTLQSRMWKELHQKSERKKEIQHALDKQITLHFEDAALIDVVKHIAQSAGINVVLDNMGLEEEGLTSDTKVSIDVTEIRLKSALNLLLKPRRLAYMIEDEVLKITGESRVQRPMTTVNYPVGNLLAVPSPDHAAISFDTLINLITSLVEPNSWSERGGQGVITQFDTTLSLVIRQTDQGHEKIRKLLDSLREAKQDDSE